MQPYRWLHAVMAIRDLHSGGPAALRAQHVQMLAAHAGDIRALLAEPPAAWRSGRPPAPLWLRRVDDQDLWQLARHIQAGLGQGSLSQARLVWLAALCRELSWWTTGRFSSLATELCRTCQSAANGADVATHLRRALIHLELHREEMA
jgi:hypothetical protein